MAALGEKSVYDAYVPMGNFCLSNLDLRGGAAAAKTVELDANEGLRDDRTRSVEGI